MKALNDNRYRLSFASLVLCFFLSLIIWSGYRLFMTNYIDRQAISAIEHVRLRSNKDSELIAESEDGLFWADIIPLTSDRRISEEIVREDFYLGYYSGILALANHHAISTEIQKIRDKEAVYYLALSSDSGEMLIFVDVTSEYQVMNLVSAFLVLILSLALVLSGFLGWQLGSSLEEDNKRQKIFFENASHDLKTPLMIIQGYMDSWESGLISQEEVSQVVTKETQKMAGLVDDIMLLSRLESGAQSLDLTTISLEELLDNLLYPLTFQAKKQGIKITVDIEESLILADPAQLERALSNILSNALRYAKETIEVSANQKEISIFNDGISLDKETSQFLFERFYTGEKGSTGIGLALTKEIIDRHGWKIQVSSERNGTIFTIILAK